MGILAVYYTVGIQNYIFSSNKPAENADGSKLAAHVFGKDGLLSAAIFNHTNKPCPDWREGGKLDPSLPAQIICQEGGNVYVAYDNEPTFHAITKDFLIQVSLAAPGIGIAVAAIEMDFGSIYEPDFHKLNKRLALVKGGFNIPIFAGNQPITKQSVRTGLPVSVYHNGEYIGKGTYSFKKEVD